MFFLFLENPEQEYTTKQTWTISKKMPFDGIFMHIMKGRFSTKKRLLVSLRQADYFWADTHVCHFYGNNSGRRYFWKIENYF